MGEKFITSMQLPSGTWYAVWESGHTLSHCYPIVIDTDSNLQQLATRHNLPVGSVVTIERKAANP